MSTRDVRMLVVASVHDHGRVGMGTSDSVPSDSE
jgi:hypothetical protein